MNKTTKDFIRLILILLVIALVIGMFGGGMVELSREADREIIERHQMWTNTFGISIDFEAWQTLSIHHELPTQIIK
tara:strand:+ start:75935 stop:76162 length:228 start_codon:yes stop_codon:yes gene_type:complete